MTEATEPDQLTYRLRYIDGTEDEILAETMTAEAGWAFFRTGTGRTVAAVPDHQIRRLDVDWPRPMAETFDAVQRIAAAAGNGAKQ